MTPLTSTAGVALQDTENPDDILTGHLCPDCLVIWWLGEKAAWLSGDCPEDGGHLVKLWVER